jgi:hypothetical protein
MASNTWSWRKVAWRIRNSDVLETPSAARPVLVPFGVFTVLLVLGLSWTLKKYPDVAASVGPAQSTRLIVIAAATGRFRAGSGLVSRVS